MQDELIQSYLAVFDTPRGETVLQDLEKQANNIQLDRRPNNDFQNHAYVNPNAALYKAGILDVIARVRRIMKRAKEENTSHGNHKDIINQVRDGSSSSD